LQLHFASNFGNRTLSNPEFSVLVVVANLMSRALAGLLAPRVNTPIAHNNAKTFLTANLL
jgi:hypothetical protein